MILSCLTTDKMKDLQAGNLIFVTASGLGSFILCLKCFFFFGFRSETEKFEKVKNRIAQNENIKLTV